MEFKVSIPAIEQAQSFLAKAGVIGFIYFITAYLGTFITPYIDAISFFELPAIALAAAFALRYGWTGILGCVVGSLLFHLLKMPWQLAATLGIGSGISAFLFNYLLRFLRPSVVTINQVSTVAAFAFIAAPIASAAHTVISILGMQWLGFMTWDSMAQTMMAWWFSELLLAYLTVPLLLSILASQKIYFEIQEKLEMGTTFVAMVIVSWLILEYGQMLASSEIIIFVLLAFVLLAALRFKTIVTDAAIFMAALIAFSALIFNVEHIHSELYSHAMFTLKIGLIPMALGGLFVASAFTERHNAEAELNKLANHDPLTSLPNRTFFNTQSCTSFSAKTTGLLIVY